MINVNNLSHPDSAYTLLKTSQQCAENYESTTLLDAHDDPPLCPYGLVSASITPVARFENNNVLPYIELNISVAVHEHADSVTVRLQCVYAPDAEDIYCHDVQRMAKTGKWIWPCRAVVFTDQKSVAVPFYFGYSCFRMFGLSQYLVNVTILPHQCRSSLLISSPSDSQLSPEIAAHYAQKNISSPDWSPLLIVDFSEGDGLWLRVEKPSSVYERIITVSIFEHHSEGVLRPLESVNVVHPSTGFKWRNVAKGSYVVYAHIPRHDCLLICEEEPSIPCRLCPHTAINFTVPADRASMSWKGLRRMRDSGSSILYALTAILAMVAISSALYIFLLRRRVKRAPVQVQEIELHVRPSVLLLSTDDCAEHTAVILALSHVLEKHIAVNVLLDHQEMSNIAVRPYRWLVDSMCRASFVMIIISPCSQLVLDGHNLKQRRPFPDLFGPAVEMIVRDCAKKNAANKYIICRLPYSPATPGHLCCLGLAEVEVPANLSRLTSLIHSIDACPVPADCSAMDEFRQAVNAMEKKMRTDEDWMEQRLSPQNASVVAEVDLEEIPQKTSDRLVNNEQRAKAAEMFGLLPPEENEVSDESSEFTLLPPDDD
ncbi:hypothetical protein Q1695_011507 [Nippostrongylus brasiliensis]|nr:hypothetical protein Q1695_011507 [Nippostrongylus brasiliensis]